MTSVPFNNLKSSDLIVDATYESDRQTNTVAAEPIGPLTGTGNQGGFRFSGSITKPEIVVLYKTMDEPDWPDNLDEETGIFQYYGDNRKPGFEIHDRNAGRGGNQILRNVFKLSHGVVDDRALVPPFLIFSKSGFRRDVIFRGLAVPGAIHLNESSDLIAIWKSIAGQRFQNYKATFTILDMGKINREWLIDIRNNKKSAVTAPLNTKTGWKQVSQKHYRPKRLALLEHLKNS